MSGLTFPTRQAGRNKNLATDHLRLTQTIKSMNFYTLFYPVRKKRGRLSKILLVMKLVIILITVACLQVSASALAQKKVTLNEKDAPLEKVFNDIRQQTGYNFLYELNILNGTSKVTINVKDANLQDVLNLCLANQPLVYTIAGNNIGVKKKEIQNVHPASAQPKEIKGEVLNKQGVPLSGASVLIKRTKTGTLTNEKGLFDLKDVLPEDILQISYIGYKTLNVQIGDKNIFNLTMEEATNALDQVVVQAYGQTTTRLNTGDISTVTAKEIEQQPVMNALTALEGKVPGLVVTQTNGYASAPFKVEIEGRADIDPSRPSEPLYIIDGVPLTILESGNAGNYSSGSTGMAQNGLIGPARGQSPLFSINPQDIESITVLKDAAATAIYGSRGANGVIIINTKKGQAGKTNFDVNFYQGENYVDSRYQLLNTQQYLAMREEALKNDNIKPNVSNAYDLLLWSPTRYTNWENEFWGNTGHTTDLETDFSGGDKQTTFRIGGSYHRETSILSAGGSDQRASIQFNLTHHSLDQKLLISFTNLISYSESNLRYSPSDVLLAPNAPPIFNSEGQPNWAGWQPVDDILSNSILQYLYQSYDAKTNFVNSALNFKYAIFKGLNISTQIGYSTSHNSQTNENPIVAQNPLNNPTGNSTFGNNNNSNLIVEPNINFIGLIGKGKIDLLLGGSFQSITQTGDILTGTGYINDLLLGSISNAPYQHGSDNYGQYKYAAIFARANYNLDDKYLIDISGRRDGSSRFGPGHQFGNFGAVGLAWIFTEESWLKDNFPLLSFGKVRASYGLTGSDNIGDYGYVSQWSGTAPTYAGSPVYNPQNLANPTLQWQTNKKLELALDLGFLKDRITAEFSVYRNIISNQLVEQNEPEITGFNYIDANFPATVENTGIMANLKAKLIDAKDFRWSVNFDFATFHNKLKSFPGIEQSVYANQYTVGESLNIKRVLHYIGVDPKTGQYTFEDKNHNGIVNYNYYPGQVSDLYDIDAGVHSDGGFGTSLHYKSFQLDLFFRYRIQPYVINPNSSVPGIVNQNESTQVLNHWQQPGQQAEYASYTTQPYSRSSDYLFYNNSDGNYSNGSYLRLQNVSITYDLKEKWAKKIGIGGCQIFARGENLFLLTKYNGIDPDVPSFGTLPPSKTFTVGLKINL
jgi:TonB-linked SusC/RagA family outer membrane protein